MRTLLRGWASTAIVGCGLLTLVSGCGDPKSKSTEATEKTPAPVPLAKTEVKPGDADLLQNIPVGEVVTNAAMRDADQAWLNLLQSMRPPPTPADWETNPPTPQALAEFKKKTGALAAEVAEKARDFYTKYPKHEMAGEARDREQYLLSVALQTGVTNALPRLLALEESKLKDPNLSEDERLQLRVGQLQRQLTGTGEGDAVARLTQFEKSARQLRKEFAGRPELDGMVASVAQAWVEAGQPEKAHKLATELVEGGLQEEVKVELERLLHRLDRLGKPLDIKFTAADGREVDLQSMKGKVVLIDFWATWCPPCMEELPNLKAAYTKLKPKGFEILGINLDFEKDEMERVLKEQQLTWPQHFEAGDETNKLVARFEVNSYPTMWLVDKKGILRDLSAREDLQERVDKLLAE